MSMLSRLSRCLVLMVGLAAWSGSVYAACASPVGNAGEVGYASNLNTLVFCNGTDWVSMAGWNNSSGGDATFLNDLSDVDTSGATTGNVLAYNGTAWVVSDSVVITTLSGLSDVNTAGATTGKILAYNGTSWVVSDTASGADNLGNHIATMGLNMGGYSISNTNLLSTTPGGIVSGTYGYFQYLSATTIYNPGSFSGNSVLVNSVSSTLISATNISATLIQAGQASATCGSSIVGAIRYNTTSNTLQICNSVGWVSLSSGTSTGTAAAAGSTGAVQFNNANALAADTSNLFWDDTNNRLGVGTSSPVGAVDISASEALRLTKQGGSANSPVLSWFRDGTRQAYIGWGIPGTNFQLAVENNNRFDVIASTTYVAGNVGIGTHNPLGGLQVSATTVHLGGTGPSIIEMGGNSVGNQYSFIDLTGDDTYTDFGLRIIRNNTGPNTTSAITARGTGGLYLQTTDAGILAFETSSIRRMTIGSDGRVGIGTTPHGAYMFHVAGDIYANGGWLRTSGNAGWFNETHGGGWYMSDTSWIRNYNSKALLIDNQIAVNTSAVALRQVYGNYGFMHYQDGTSYYMLLTNSGDQYGTYNTLRPFRVDIANGNVVMANGGVTVAHSSGNITAAAFLYSSDKRLKENITTLTGGLAKLDTLTPVSFSYISDTTHRKRIGVIAQEVEKVYPEAVVTDEKGDRKSVV